VKSATQFMSIPVRIRKILIGFPIKDILNKFRRQLRHSDRYRKKLKRRISRLPYDREWRCYSPCPLTPTRLLSIIDAYEHRIELPPIILREVGSTGFFRIINGRHRLTLAIALGRRYIRAKFD
jgi:hypothetical protein